jgi:hypothetical protein
MDKDAIAIEYVKIYFACHPEELPNDQMKALEKMREFHKKYKNKIIEDFKSKSDKYVDKFMDDKKDRYY